MRIDARDLDHRELNKRIRAALLEGAETVQLDHINGQRYIGAGLRNRAQIIVNGVPGNDLAAFMDGPEIIVNANAQDAAGNTMNSGKIIIHGDARDLIGYSMRGGKIFVRGSVGYRVGIHMKSFKDQAPVLIIGGAARDFLGEYMAGGIIVVLGLNLPSGAGEHSPVLTAQRTHRGGAQAVKSVVSVAHLPRPTVAKAITGHFVGTGMHGGCIFIRGAISEENLGKEVRAFPLEAEDKNLLAPLLREYAQAFDLDYEHIVRVGGREPFDAFTKLMPVTHRPYGRLYAY